MAFESPFARLAAGGTPARARLAAAASPARLAALLAEQVEALAAALVGSPPNSRGRTEWRFRRRGSLAVLVAGDKRGAWFDHEAGEGGDALELVRHLRGGTVRDAVVWAQCWLGVRGEQTAPRPAAEGDPRPRPAREPLATLPLARRLWAEASSPAGTLVAAYLRSRGLDLPPKAPLRFHPSAWRNPAFGPRGPAMVALMTDPSGYGADACPLPVGVHLTYLRADGGGKAGGERAKIMIGGAGVVRLVPDAEVTVGLGVAEGVETALAVAQRTGWSPVWAAASAGGIARFPVLAGVASLTVFADADDGGAGLGAAERCAARWVEAGREARVIKPPAGSDFGDVLGQAG